VTPAYDADVCETVGSLAGVITWGRVVGRTLAPAFFDAVKEASRDLADLEREIIPYASTHPDLTPDDVHAVWQRVCQARLGQPTPSGAAMRRVRQVVLETLARRGLLPQTGGSRQ
jgi:hypothetical protein